MQMPHQELASYVREQIEQNPLLMQPEGGESLYSDEPTNCRIVTKKTYGDDDYARPDLKETLTLREHLYRQLLLEISDPDDRKIGECLIDHLNDNGFLDGDLDTIGLLLSVPVMQVERVLSRLQEFDPPGVFARNLGECFALQIKDRHGTINPDMALFLENLELFLHHPLPKIAKDLGLTVETCQSFLKDLKSLSAKPAEQFSPVAVESLIPDVLMQPSRDPDQNDAWNVVLNTEALPAVLLNSDYYHTLKKQLVSREDRSYLTAQHGQANWLLQALHQRATNTLRVALEIVQHQSAFWTEGFQAFKPLTLRQVADAVGLHESTVSRVVASKYIATPRGIFSFKFFFSSTIVASKSNSFQDESLLSSRMVQYKMKILIDRENQGQPLSDEDLVLIMQQDGVPIARRTINKYRKVLSIPSSAERRRLYQLQSRGAESHVGMDGIFLS